MTAPNPTNVKPGTWIALEFGFLERCFYVISVNSDGVVLGHPDWLTSAMTRASWSRVATGWIIGQGKLRWWWRLVPWRDAVVPFTFPTPQQGEVLTNPWKDAIDDALVTACIAPIGEDETPRKALARLINWEIQTALDPAVSSDAQALIERGRKEASVGLNERTFVKVADRMPPDETQVIVKLVSGKQRIAELCWEQPGFEDTFEAFRYWSDTDGSEIDWNDVVEWTDLPS